MKQNLSVFRKTGLIFLISISALSSSCSYFANRSGMLGSKDKEDTPLPTVPKEQYDQLMNKYESLLTRVQKLESNNPNAEQNEKASVGVLSGDIVNDLASASEQSDLVETVDVFGGQKGKNVVPEYVSDQQIENQIIKIKKATSLVYQNKFDQALSLLKDLEHSKNKYIRVRAKFYLGELLYKQGEYDLAAQVFEGILQKYAFSHFVIKSLGRLIVCSEKLKQGKKREQYYSMLHDFFGVK